MYSVLVYDSFPFLCFKARVRVTVFYVTVKTVNPPLTAH